MDQKAFSALIKQARKSGFEGKTFSEFKSWAEDEMIGDFTFPGGKSYSIDDVEKAWSKKTVVISYDPAADDVVIDEMDGEAEMGEEEAEAKMEDEDEAEAKSLKSEIRSNRRTVGKARTINGRVGKSVGRNDYKMLAYDTAVKNGGKWGGQPVVLSSADQVELFGAYCRLSAMGEKSYGQKSVDEKIVGKAGSTLVNSTGAALVFGEYFPELIENINENGAARQAIGVTSMREGQRTVSRIANDVTVYKVNENAEITASDPTFNNVVLTAEKIAALTREPNELLNDSAFDVGAVLSRSVPRAVGTYEDEAVLLGQNGYQGITGKIDADTTFDAALSSSWSEFTVSDIQDTLAQLPGWAYGDPNFGIVCSSAFYQSVLRRFSLSSGGVTGVELASGGAPRYMYDGYPVYISEVMPKTYAGDAVVMLAGAWSYSAKLGIVNGSEQMASSPDRYFEYDQVGFRYTQRWAFSLHDVNGTANESGIVGLQD
jgi:HK97 family phage major capsid protein